MTINLPCLFLLIIPIFNDTNDRFFRIIFGFTQVVRLTSNENGVISSKTTSRWALLKEKETYNLMSLPMERIGMRQSLPWLDGDRFVAKSAPRDDTMLSFLVDTGVFPVACPELCRRMAISSIAGNIFFRVIAKQFQR